MTTRLDLYRAHLTVEVAALLGKYGQPASQLMDMIASGRDPMDVDDLLDRTHQTLSLLHAADSLPAPPGAALIPGHSWGQDASYRLYRLRLSLIQGERDRIGDRACLAARAGVLARQANSFERGTGSPSRAPGPLSLLRRLLGRRRGAPTLRPLHQRPTGPASLPSLTPGTTREPSDKR